MLHSREGKSKCVSRLYQQYEHFPNADVYIKYLPGYNTMLYKTNKSGLIGQPHPLNFSLIPTCSLAKSSYRFQSNKQNDLFAPEALLGSTEPIMLFRYPPCRRLVSSHDTFYLPINLLHPYKFEHEYKQC